MGSVIGFDYVNLEDVLSLKDPKEFILGLGDYRLKDHGLLHSSEVELNQARGSSMSCFDFLTKSRIIRLISAVMLVLKDEQVTSNSSLSREGILKFIRKIS